MPVSAPPSALSARAAKELVGRGVPAEPRGRRGRWGRARPVSPPASAARRDAGVRPALGIVSPRGEGVGGARRPRRAAWAERTLGKSLSGLPPGIRGSPGCRCPPRPRHCQPARRRSWWGEASPPSRVGGEDAEEEPVPSPPRHPRLAGMPVSAPPPALSARAAKELVGRGVPAEPRGRRGRWGRACPVPSPPRHPRLAGDGSPHPRADSTGAGSRFPTGSRTDQGLSPVLVPSRPSTLKGWRTGPATRRGGARGYCGRRRVRGCLGT